MEKADYMKLLAATIRTNYSGDPLALNPFLASIDLIIEIIINSRFKCWPSESFKTIHND